MILQPSDLFRLLNIKDHDTAKKVMTATLSFLVYLKPGDKLETSGVVFEKMTEDLLHIQVNVNSKDMMDTLEKLKVIRIPV